MSITPVVSNLPSATTAFQNKYTTGSLAPVQQSQVLAALNRLPLPRAASPQNIINPLALYDLQRANRGMSPLTTRQTVAAARSLATGKPATPPRRQGVGRSFISDLREAVGGIFKLPGALLNEARQLPEVPGLAARAISESSNPLEAIGNVAAVPGFRFVPGAFVANQLLGEEGQGVQGLLSHPLFTALDVLPLASGAAKMTGVAKTAATAYEAQVEALTAARVAKGLDESTTILPPAPRPLATALTRRLDPAGNVIPNAFGRGLETARDTAISTTPGNLVQQLFGERFSSRIMNRATTGLREAADPAIHTEALRPNVPGGAASIPIPLAIRDLSTSIQNRLKAELERTGITPDDFYTRAATGKLPDGTIVPPEQMLDLSPELRAIARDVRDLTAREHAYTSSLPGGTRSVTINGTPEVYDYQTAQRLTGFQRKEQLARETLEARQAALATTDSPSPLSVAEITSRLDALPARADLTAAAKRDLTALYTAARDNLHFGLRDDIARSIPVIRALEKEYRTIPRLISHLQAGRWAEANKGLRALSRTRAGRALPLDLDEMRARITGLVAHERALQRTSAFTEKRLAREITKRERAELRHSPARFDEATGEVAKERIRGSINERFSSAPDLDTLLTLADEGIYDHLISRVPEMQQIIRKDQAAARASWKALRDAGQDPIFFQRVTRVQARRQPFIRVSDTPTTLQATKARMMDAAPYVRDVGVIVNQGQLDILRQISTDAALADISTSFGRTRASIVEELTPRLMARLGKSDVAGRELLDKMISQRWIKFDGSKYGGSARASTFAVEGAEDIYIPRAMAENLRRMYETTPSKLSTVLDPITKTFRTSVLPLALRWQLNNLIGGAIVTAINDPRAFLELPSVVRQLWGERKLVPDAADRLMPEGAPPAGFGTSMSPERGRWDVDAGFPIRDRLSAASQYGVGAKLKEFFDTARSDRISKIPDAFHRRIEQLYGANQFVDDVYRASIGQSQYKRFLGKGYSEEAARALQAQSIRRAFQAWDDMTPMERSVMRSVVPFYGFAAYSTKFALRYPFDHPFRASVLGSIARAELTDAMTGLPDYIREMIFLGDPRANKVTRALNVGPFNPFGGVPSMFTVAGFTGQLNPAISGVLESIGVDTRAGGPQLYPELRYDPETGRLVADPSGNLFSNILGNTIPQLSGVTALLGFNDQFNESLQRDPGAAGRMLLSAFGVPVLFRDVKVGEQLIRSEMARFEDQETARKDALRTGDLGILDDFPGLKAYAAQVQALSDSGALDTLHPTEGQPGTPSGAGRAYAAQVALLGG